ncbi:restriction endonuclease [Parageobacillus thermoglucosidasius]|uniref:restriction endonuclease n=1 Tax=Parageobacillus thermoglucosidasius TaxID=1426 RepID=UPI003D28AB3F
MSKFNINNDFIKLKQSLISKKRWTFLDFGEIGDFYLILIDNQGFLINEDLEINKYHLEKIRFYKETEYRFSLEFPFLVDMDSHCILDYKSFLIDEKEKEKIVNYIDSLSIFEPTFLKQLDNYKANLISNAETKFLLTNFLDLYFKDFYKRIDNVYYLEDDLLAHIFCRNKTYDYYIVEEARKKIDANYEKLLDLFFKKGILKKEDIGEKDIGYLLLTRCLRNIAIEYYAKEFEDSYKGYFPSLKEMSLDDCINAYYQIDFLEKNDTRNIGLLTYYLFSNNSALQIASNYSLMEAYELLKEKVSEYEDNLELIMFERQLMNHNKPTKRRNGFENVTIDDIDLMSGKEFEEFIYELFKKMGYTVNLTPESGDQGIDIIAVKNGLRIGIQTKCYSNSVSNKAIQEVVAGIKYYGLEKAIVVTNNYFTKSAIELALANEVVLWDRNILKEKLNDINNKASN